MNFIGGTHIFYTEMVFGSRDRGRPKEAHISEKGPTKTRHVDFVNAWQPDAEFEPTANRTLPDELFYPLGSSLALSMLCEQTLEPGRHQDWMHGCVRWNVFEKTTVEPKNENRRQMMFQPRSNVIVKTVEKTSVEPKFQSCKLMSQPGHRQNGAEFKGEPRDDSVNVSLNYLLMQCYQDPVPTGLPNFPLSQPHEAHTDGLKLSTMERASHFPCDLESRFNALSLWSEEPDAKSPFLALLPSYREEQAVLSQITLSPKPSEYLHFESEVGQDWYVCNSKKERNEQATPGLTATSGEGIVPSTAPSNSPTEYISWKPNWSTKNLLFQLTGFISDMYNLFLKDQEVLSSSIVPPRLEEKSCSDQKDRNSYWPLSSFILLLSI